MARKKRDPRGLNGVLGGRPTLPIGAARVPISATVRADTLSQIDAIAAKTGMSRGLVIDAILFFALRNGYDNAV